MAQEYLRIGHIGGGHSLNGGLKVLVTTDNLDRFTPGNTVYIQRKGGYVPYSIEDFSIHKNRIGLLHLKGVMTREEADSLKGLELCIDMEQAEETRKDLEEDSYYYYDIIGCRVYLDDRPFGTVTDIMQAGAGEILVIQAEDGKKHMVPFVESMTDTRLIDEKRIDIFPVEGLLDI